MDLLPIDEKAGWLSGIIFALFVLWKLWLRVKLEHREDRSGARSSKSEERIVSGYDALIEKYREEVDRLAHMVDVLSVEVEKQRDARYKALQLAEELRHRVDVLEQRVRDLGHTP